MEDKNIKCSNCETVVTPLWRRGSNGSYLCNACGLYYKIHRSNRPIEMKSDSFRHRQRSKKYETIYDLRSAYIKKFDGNGDAYAEEGILSSDYDDDYDDNIIDYIKLKKGVTRIKFASNDKLSKKIKAFKKIEKHIKKAGCLLIDNNDSSCESNKKIIEREYVLSEDEKNLSIEELERIAVEVLVNLSKDLIY